MTTKQSSQIRILLKQLAVIPLLVSFLFLFAQRIEAQEKAKDKIVTEYNTLAKEQQQIIRDNGVVRQTEIKKLENLYAQLNESQKKIAEPFPKSSTSINKNEEPIFYLNGKVISKKKIDSINYGNIKSVNVIKNKNGSSTVSIKKKREPLYYLDGKAISKKEMEKIKPNTIERVNVENNKDGSGAVYIISKKN
jgi:hypothetical protein